MVHAEFFGDAFQYVHRGLLRAIAPPNAWIVHPMLFRRVDGGPPGGGLDLTHYAQFLGLPREAILPEARNGIRLTRQTTVADVAPYAGHYLFLDPDTGIDENGGGRTHMFRHNNWPRLPGRATVKSYSSLTTLMASRQASHRTGLPGSSSCSGGRTSSTALPLLFGPPHWFATSGSRRCTMQLTTSGTGSYKNSPSPPGF